MSKRQELESAIFDAEGSLCIIEMMEDHLFGAPATDGQYTFNLSMREFNGFARAINVLRADLKVVSAMFYNLER